MSDVAGGSPGINKFARVISRRMREVSEGNVSDIEPDFGTINKDGSLTTDMFPIPIPKGEYHLGRLVSGLKVNVSGGFHGGHTAGTGDHGHNITLPKVKEGDRVLVVWVRDEAVVVDVIKKS